MQATDCIEKSMMTGEIMNDAFEMKVRAAAIAGWWTLLIAAIFLTIQWIVYLLLMSTQPAWLPSLWGPGVDWGTIQRLWFWLLALLKLSLGLLALPVLWLTLWARQLRRSANGSFEQPGNMVNT